MASHLAPAATRAWHRSVHHFVADSGGRTRRCCCAWRSGSCRRWTSATTATGLPRQGTHSVGVAHQSRGMLGNQDNGQVAASVSLAAQGGSLPVAWRLYLPKEWCGDEVRREKAGVPKPVAFATKPARALAQIEQLLDQGAPRHCVLADAGYGTETAFRERLSEPGLTCVVGTTGQVTVWPPGHAPLPPAAYSGRGKVPTRQRPRETAHQRPQSMKERAHALACRAMAHRRVAKGSNVTLRSRFARVRVRAAQRDDPRDALRPEPWALIEWPKGHQEPTPYRLSTLPEDMPIERMVFEATVRWRIERDCQDLKQDLGHGDCEVRGWRGFLRHASLAIAASGFLMAQQRRHPEGAGQTKLCTARRSCPAHACQARRQPSARSATSHRPSRACGCASPQPCSRRCQDARVASAQTQGFAPDTARPGGPRRRPAPRAGAARPVGSPGLAGCKPSCRFAGHTGNWACSVGRAARAQPAALSQGPVRTYPKSAPIGHAA